MTLSWQGGKQGVDCEDGKTMHKADCQAKADLQRLPAAPVLLDAH